MQHKRRNACIPRLKRIEGQVRGIARMVEEERYCIEIMMQIAAVSAALDKVKVEILKDHVDHCVEEAIAHGDAAEQREKFNELVDMFSRYRA